MLVRKLGKYQARKRSTGWRLINAEALVMSGQPFVGKPKHEDLMELIS